MMEINRLTSDEDLRQELWLYFLEGNSPFSLKDRLLQIEESEKINNKIISYMRWENLYGSKEKF